MFCLFGVRRGGAVPADLFDDRHPGLRNRFHRAGTHRVVCRRVDAARVLSFQAHARVDGAQAPS